MSPSPEVFLIFCAIIVGIMTIVCISLQKIPGDICGPNVFSTSAYADIPADEISLPVPCAAFSTLHEAKRRALSEDSG